MDLKYRFFFFLNTNVAYKLDQYFTSFLKVIGKYVNAILAFCA